MKKALLLATAVAFAAAPLLAQETPRRPDRVTTPVENQRPDATRTASPDRGVIFQPESVSSDGSVTVEGQRIDYRAVAGTLVVHPKGWDDAAWRARAANAPGENKPGELGEENKNPQAEASMFYVAYFKKGVPAPGRPITFLYNGGPGSSTVWLHMGAFGPRRIVTADHEHTPAAPYGVVDNAFSLLDASDLVFIDAPGTGFSRIAGKDKEKAFWGVDADAYAFSQFILGFLSKYGRWNSPKYLFGESYGTPRSAVVVNQLQSEDDVDFNGVILLSQILNFDIDADGPENNPGIDQAYIAALPTYAATTWYHNRLAGPRPENLEPFLHEVEQFATTDYAMALQQGSELDPQRRQQIAQRLAGYTGLPVDYILKANLRISGGEFEKNLQDPAGLTTGRLDTRFSGPTMDPLSKEADYDPQSAAISSAYVSAFNDYVRNRLGYGGETTFRPEVDVFKYWEFKHQVPGASVAFPGATNVMPDMAQALKYNPNLRVLVAGGYFDLATPFYQGWYEMHHLQVPPALLNNIEFHYYPSGHMVYANEQSLKGIHDDVSAFIRRTSGGH
ncbi:MAG TPA: peptidase S10 [Allosphingosinicella sp.]|nr:peptidase S10 [Allosphingosinicella sp.]